MKMKLSVLTALCCFLPLSSFASNLQMITGDYTSTKNKPLPLLAINSTENNWIYPTLPELPNDIIYTYLSGAGCTSTFCAAVGTYNKPEYHPIIAISFNKGNQWSYVSKLGENNNPLGQIYNLSCNSELCVAVGEDDQHAVAPYYAFPSTPLLSVGRGNEWTVPTSIANGLPDLHDGSFENVTCNDSFCMAAGEYRTNDNHAYPMIAVSTDKDKANWTYSSNMTNLIPQDVEIVDVLGLNCTDKVCIISGLYRLPSQKEVAFLATSYDQGKSWTSPTDITSKLPDAFYTRLDKVTCEKDLCVAAGTIAQEESSKSSPLIAVSHDTGKTWKYINNLESKLPANYQYAELWNVDCNEKICLAGGQLSLNDYKLINPAFLMYSKDQGETWSMLTEFPKDYAGGSFTDGINCNSTSCSAIGDYRTTSEKQLPLLVTTQDGNTWSYPSSIIDNLPQDYSYGHFYFRNSSSSGLKGHKKA